MPFKRISRSSCNGNFTALGWICLHICRLFKHHLPIFKTRCPQIIFCYQYIDLADHVLQSGIVLYQSLSLRVLLLATASIEALSAVQYDVFCLIDGPLDYTLGMPEIH